MARPKSERARRPSAMRRMFWGVMSRWTMPTACRAARPAQTACAALTKQLLDPVTTGEDRARLHGPQRGELAAAGEERRRSCDRPLVASFCLSVVHLHAHRPRAAPLEGTGGTYTDGRGCRNQQ